MDIFSIFTMVGGLALFLFGMDFMGANLSKASGGKLERILERLTSNPVKAVLLGAGVTAVIQSSSATTVMVVGFVNSGVMKLSQAVGIIMGANVGTTITSWILSLSGIQSDNFFVRMLKPSSFSPILAMVGIVLYMFTKKEKNKNIGGILLGFAVLMTGMETMSSAVAPLKNIPAFTNLFTMFTNPFIGMIVGAVLTAVIQSSSASVGILQALCSTGAVPYGAAIPIIMGQNIGTCVTAMISSVGASKNAKRAAFIHLYFNVLGTGVFMVVFYTVHVVRPFAFLEVSANAAGIAVVHSIFNIAATMVLLPFAEGLEKLAYLTVRDRSSGLSDDQYEDRLGQYLMKVSSHDLSENDSYWHSVLLHCINDLERISDHAVNVMESAREMEGKAISFSESASQEIHVLCDAVREIVGMSLGVLREGDAEEADRVANHCSNIAVSILETPQQKQGAHAYLQNRTKEEAFKRTLTNTVKCITFNK